MYKHPSTIEFSSLTQFGNTIIPAESGWISKEPENIVAFIEDDLK
jgi:hypothetical protein